MTTAVLKVQNNLGNCFMGRALLDSCSTVNLITENFAKSLNIPKQTCSIHVGDINGLSTLSRHYIKATFSSTCNKFKQELNFLTVTRIAELVPNETFPRHLFDIPKNLQLTDPQFYVPKSVDILLAAGTTLSLLSIGQIKLRCQESQTILQKTTLGWIVAGGSDVLVTSAMASCNVAKLDKLIERFWAIGDFDHEPLKSRDDVACEQHFVHNTLRDDTGRYIVRLPFRDSKFQVGESRNQALKRLYAIEKKFESNSQLKSENHQVLNQYIALNHMTLRDDIKEGCYLSHHAVIKTASETTKVRVVFDASAKTSTGISLNEVLLVGPTIQNAIIEQVLRFRTHTYVITAEIEMYWQVLVYPDDRKF
ncbi:uncharacterized protein LOC117173589 [Belonocnema kinseyi]|uniref:uncharacterized protein LOC117173589 n=1 Tax=Belonocnema kinseyi TaxID=2817044 RepID=UPI00143DFF41|nr:uncharacterized protein LOC117173589 [Belonocnema kinseyi]